MSEIRNRKKILEKIDQDDTGPLDEEEQVIVIEELRADNDVWNTLYLRVLSSVGFFGTFIKLYFAYSAYLKGEKMQLYSTSNTSNSSTEVPIQVILILEIVDAVLFGCIAISLLLHDPKKRHTNITLPSWRQELGESQKDPYEESLEIRPVKEQDQTTLPQLDEPHDHFKDFSQILQTSTLLFNFLLLFAVSRLFYVYSEEWTQRDELLWEIFWFSGLNFAYCLLGKYALQTIENTEKELQNLSRFMYPYKTT